MTEPSAVELQAHAIMTAMEAAHKILVEDFWQRDGRAWLKYSHPGGPMWTLTITPWPMDADPEPVIEWGVRHADWNGRVVPYYDKANAILARDDIAARKPDAAPVLVWREAGRPAGPWNEEAAGEPPASSTE